MRRIGPTATSSRHSGECRNPLAPASSTRESRTPAFAGMTAVLRRSLVRTLAPAAVAAKPGAPGRRDFLVAAAAGLVVLALPARAAARPSLDEAIRGFTGGADPRSGKVRLDIPPLVENGNAVGVTVTVDSAMSVDDHVRRIALFNEKNPQADVAVFHLGPRAGRARIATRIRLATAQTVVAVAEMSDGSFWADRTNVIVTLAACIEDLA